MNDAHSRRIDRIPGETDRDYDLRAIAHLIIDGLSEDCSDNSLAVQAHEAFKRIAHPVKSQASIAMRLPCERCGTLHIDKGHFATHPHHTHTCQHCGLTWRPAKEHTVGVQFIPGFKDDGAPPDPIVSPLLPAIWSNWPIRAQLWDGPKSEGLGSQASDPRPASMTSWKVGDWARFTPGDGRDASTPFRVKEVRSESGLAWVIPEGHRRPMVDPAVMTPWRPRVGETVIVTRYQVQTKVTEIGLEHCRTSNPCAGREWFVLSELEPYLGQAERPIVHGSTWQYRDGWQGCVAEIHTNGLGHERTIIACGPAGGPVYEWPKDAFLRAFSWVRDP